MATLRGVSGVVGLVLIVGLCRGADSPMSPNPTEQARPDGMPQLLPDPTNTGTANGRPTVLPDDVPESRPPGVVVLFSDFLLLRATRTGTEYALVDSNQDSVPEGVLRVLKTDYHAGFRVGGRFRPGRLEWDIGAAYSHWRGNDSELLVAPAGGQLYAQHTRPGLVETADVASTRARLGWNVYDLEFGREFTSDSSRLRAHFGVRITDANLNLLTLYDGRDAALARVLSDQQFVGAGPMIGGEANWHIGRFLKLFAQGRGGTVIGILESTWRETNFDEQIVYADLWFRRQQVVPVLELLLGGGLKVRRFQVEAGYMVTAWFQLFQHVDFPDDLHEGKAIIHPTPTSLDGILIRMAFRF
jgi:hypothetical protein